MKDKTITQASIMNATANPTDMRVTTSMTGPEARRGSATQISPWWGVAIASLVTLGVVASQMSSKPATAGKKKSKKKKK